MSDSKSIKYVYYNTAGFQFDTTTEFDSVVADNAHKVVKVTTTFDTVKDNSNKPYSGKVYVLTIDEIYIGVYDALDKAMANAQSHVSEYISWQAEHNNGEFWGVTVAGVNSSKVLCITSQEL